jgi:hypothetical protein
MLCNSGPTTCVHDCRTINSRRQLPSMDLGLLADWPLSNVQLTAVCPREGESEWRLLAEPGPMATKRGHRSDYRCGGQNSTHSCRSDSWICNDRFRGYKGRSRRRVNRQTVGHVAAVRRNSNLCQSCGAFLT